MLQRHAIEKFHGDESLTVLLANVMNRADVGVVERGSSLRFALEAAERLRIASHFVGKKFQGDKSAQPGILGLVNHAHAASTQLLDNSVM